MTVSQPDGVADLGFARLDLERAQRTGDPEVVFGQGKTPDQIVTALSTLREAHPDRAILATRLSEEAIERCRERLPEAGLDPVGRTAVLGERRARRAAGWPWSPPAPPTCPSYASAR